MDSINFPTEIRPRIGFESVDGQSGAWLPPCNGSQPCSTPETVQLADTRITVVADLGPDLAVDDVVTPATGRPGLPVPAQFRLRNLHQQSGRSLSLRRLFARTEPDEHRGGNTGLFSAPRTLAAVADRTPSP